MTRGGEWAERIQKFQEALLPQAVVSSGHADVEAAFVSRKGQLSGDFYDCIPLDGHDAYLIGDVTGHGLPAALVVGVLYGAVREAFHFTKHPCEILEHLHELLADLGKRSGGPRVFSASMYIAVLSADGRLSHANAGHPSPLLLRRRRKAEPLHPMSPPLGLVPPTDCVVQELQLAPGDRLVLFSDGCIPQHGSPEDVREEIDRVSPLPPDELARHLVGRGTDDDRTAVVVTYRGRRG